jgi:F0F1-type ATP synthase membrane subunit c/vacuolar-type H+-ATPase subunit K
MVALHSRNLPEPFRARVRMLYIIFAAFVHATFIYAVIAVLGLVSIEPPTLPVPLWIPVALLSILTLPSAFVVGGALNPSRENDPDRFLSRVQQRLIVQAAIFEAIAIYGLVGSFFGLSPVIALAIIAASTFLILALLPGLVQNVDRLRRMLVDSQPATPTTS